MFERNCKRSVIGGVLALACVAFLGLALAPGQAYAQTATVVQELSGPFDNPEGSVVGADGSTVFVSSAAAIDGDFRFMVGAGYITKLSIGSDGKLSVVDAQFVTGLTRPWGMAVLPFTVGSIPAGTVFVGVGGPPLADSTGAPITDVSQFKSGIVAFDPDDGTVLGMIDTGPNSAFETVSGGPVLAINALAFDQSGSLYFTDTGLAGGSFTDSGILPIRQGVWQVVWARLPDLLAGNTTDTTALSFCNLQGAPDGIAYCPMGNLYANTVGEVAVGFGGELYCPYYGAIYHLTQADFDAGYVVNPPLYENLGALDGLVFTPGGTMLNTEIMLTGDVVAITPDGNVTFLGVPNLAGPADISVATVGGSYYVYIPEHTSGAEIAPADDQVTVIKLTGAP